jgi:hypothetical protein
MEAHMEGFDQGPRHVLQTKPAGLRGRLLDLIEIDVAMAPLSKRRSARTCRRSSSTRASTRPRSCASSPTSGSAASCCWSKRPSARRRRVLGVVVAAEPPSGVHYLTDLVRHVIAAGATDDANASEKLLGWLLRGVVVADFDIADSARADLCFVTPDGTLVCGPRMEGGAAAEGHSGLVVRRSQIRSSANRRRRRAAEAAGAAGRQGQATGRVDRLKRELKAIGDALATVRRAAQAAQAQESRLAARVQDVARELAELAHEAGELSRAVLRRSARLGGALFDQFLLARVSNWRSPTNRTFGTRIADAEIRTRRQQQRAEQELRIRQVQTGEVREGLVRSIRMHEEALRDFERALQELADRQQDAEDDRTKAPGRAGAAQRTGGGARRPLAELEADKLDRQAAVDEAAQQRARVQQDVQEWEQAPVPASEALTQTRLHRADVEHRFLRLEDRLREDTGVELRRCLGEIEGIGLEDHRRPSSTGRSRRSASSTSCRARRCRRRGRAAGTACSACGKQADFDVGRDAQGSAGAAEPEGPARRGQPRRGEGTRGRGRPVQRRSSRRSPTSRKRGGADGDAEEARSRVEDAVRADVPRGPQELPGDLPQAVPGRQGRHVPVVRGGKNEDCSRPASRSSRSRPASSCSRSTCCPVANAR